jgi:hypothetical protein
MVKLYKIEILYALCYTSCLCWIYGQADVKSEGIKIPMVTTLHGTDITLVGNHPFTSLQVLVSINLI